MEPDGNFVNTYIENLAAELVKEQREKVLLKTQLMVLQKKLEQYELEQKAYQDSKKEPNSLFE